MATQSEPELELRCLFELKWGICSDTQGPKPVTLTSEDRKETAESKSLSESDTGQIVMLDNGVRAPTKLRLFCSVPSLQWEPVTEK